jgi:uncharacterized membrane protein YbhN (UPF0104 family)
MPAAELQGRPAGHAGRNALRVGIRLLIGLALLYASLRPVHWGDLLAGVSGAALTWVALAEASVLASTAFKVARWALLLASCGQAPGFWALAEAFVVGQAANVVFPFRGGDVVRIGWTTLRRDSSVAPATLTVLLEKYLDLLALLALLLWLGPLLPLEALERRRIWLAPLGIGLSALLALAAWALPALWPQLRRALVGSRWLAARGSAGRVAGWLEQLPSLTGLRAPRAWLPLAGMTVLIWTTMLATNVLMLRALGLTLDWRAGALVLALIYVGVAPALMPGNIGPFYFFAMLGLAPFGVNTGQRAAFAVLLHAVVTMTPVALAVGFLAVGRWKWGGRR